MKKNVLSVLLSVALVFTSLTVPTFAETPSDNVIENVVEDDDVEEEVVVDEVDEDDDEDAAVEETAVDDADEEVEEEEIVEEEGVSDNTLAEAAVRNAKIDISKITPVAPAVSSNEVSFHAKLTYDSTYDSYLTGQKYIEYTIGTKKYYVSLNAITFDQDVPNFTFTDKPVVGNYAVKAKLCSLVEVTTGGDVVGTGTGAGENGLTRDQKYKSIASSNVFGKSETFKVYEPLTITELQGPTAYTGTKAAPQALTADPIYGDLSVGIAVQRSVNGEELCKNDDFKKYAYTISVEGGKLVKSAYVIANGVEGAAGKATVDEYLLVPSQRYVTITLKYASGVEDKFYYTCASYAAGKTIKFDSAADSKLNIVTEYANDDLVVLSTKATNTDDDLHLVVDASKVNKDNIGDYANIVATLPSFENKYGDTPAFKGYKVSTQAGNVVKPGTYSFYLVTDNPSEYKPAPFTVVVSKPGKDSFKLANTAFTITVKKADIDAAGEAQVVIPADKKIEAAASSKNVYGIDYTSIALLDYTKGSETNSFSASFNKVAKAPATADEYIGFAAGTSTAVADKDCTGYITLDYITTDARKVTTDPIKVTVKVVQEKAKVSTCVDSSKITLTAAKTADLFKDYSFTAKSKVAKGYSVSADNIYAVTADEYELAYNTVWVAKSGAGDNHKPTVLEVYDEIVNDTNGSGAGANKVKAVPDSLKASNTKYWIPAASMVDDMVIVAEPSAYVYDVTFKYVPTKTEAAELKAGDLDAIAEYHLFEVDDKDMANELAVNNFTQQPSTKQVVDSVERLEYGHTYMLVVDTTSMKSAENSDWYFVNKVTGAKASKVLDGETSGHLKYKYVLITPTGKDKVSIVIGEKKSYKVTAKASGADSGAIAFIDDVEDINIVSNGTTYMANAPYRFTITTSKDGKSQTVVVPDGVTVTVGCINSSDEIKGKYNYSYSVPDAPSKTKKIADGVFKTGLIKANTTITMKTKATKTKL